MATVIQPTILRRRGSPLAGIGETAQLFVQNLDKRRKKAVIETAAQKFLDTEDPNPRGFLRATSGIGDAQELRAIAQPFIDQEEKNILSRRTRALFDASKASGLIDSKVEFNPDAFGSPEELQTSIQQQFDIGQVIKNFEEGARRFDTTSGQTNKRIGIAQQQATTARAVQQSQAAIGEGNLAVRQGELTVSQSQEARAAVGDKADREIARGRLQETIRSNTARETIQTFSNATDRLEAETDASGTGTGATKDQLDVAATAQIYGLDIKDSKERNIARFITNNADDTRAQVAELFTKSAPGALSRFFAEGDEKFLNMAQVLAEREMVDGATVSEAVQSAFDSAMTGAFIRDLVPPENLPVGEDGTILPEGRDITIDALVSAFGIPREKASDYLDAISKNNSNGAQ